MQSKLVWKCSLSQQTLKMSSLHLQTFGYATQMAVSYREAQSQFTGYHTQEHCQGKQTPKKMKYCWTMLNPTQTQFKSEEKVNVAQYNLL